VNSPIQGVSVLVSLGLAVGAVRADLVSYSFAGIEANTGISVIGSFAYQTNVAGINQGANDVFFGDVGGSLSITAGGHTYWNSSVSATLLPGSLELNGRNPNGDGAGVVLASPDFSTVFPSVASLPATLNLDALRGSSFTIDVYPPLPVPGNVAPRRWSCDRLWPHHEPGTRFLGPGARQPDACVPSASRVHALSLEADGSTD
jgi:hypothetical protein